MKNFKSYSNEALVRLSEDSSVANTLEIDELNITEKEELIEGKINLTQERIEWVSEKIKLLGGQKIVDLGCGEGKLISHLMKDSFFKYITGADVSIHSLSRARKKLNIDNLPSFQKNRVNLMQTALTYRDQRLAGYDVATLIEVIEHVDLPRLDSLKRVVFEFAKPSFVIITTPNAEYNSLFENLPIGQFRHNDHRFEWTREEFRIWAEDIAKKFGYNVTFEDIGTKHEILGSPTQAGVFIQK
ncbi:MAG: methyltransferase domain-containing protein [Rickettsiaceae bacterium]|nr:methyltransferase domain-containing protein [Rickettsiaceae bacterium]